MSFDPIYRGWDIPSRLWLALRGLAFGGDLRAEIARARDLAERVERKLERLKLNQSNTAEVLATEVTTNLFAPLGVEQSEIEKLPLFNQVANLLTDIIVHEQWFTLPNSIHQHSRLTRAEVWEAEDQIKRVEQRADNLPTIRETFGKLANSLVNPLVEHHPSLLTEDTEDQTALQFPIPILRSTPDLPSVLDHIVQLPFASELDEFDLVAGLRERLEYNLAIASGAKSGSATSNSFVKLPSKAPPMPAEQLVDTYLSGTPLPYLFDLTSPLAIPQTTRVEHQHIVAGSGHGKTQTLQHFILHDLEAVERGEASVVVIDSQSDLIENIASLSLFAPGGPLAERLIVIDPTDIEWPVALNLFDAGFDRMEQYAPLEREKLTNSILELYDFVLGSLLDAGMTQKQNVIFRYITRLLLHIPNATIHTLRELLEDDGYETYRPYMDKLEGTARAFFAAEFMSKEFVATKKQVLRRLYGILENQTFERMFSHPKSKLDLFAEMNAGKVILINTAKDLLKENGTQIFGRFFIAMIAQAAQERATMDKEDRLFTTVYVDEAQDYFDQNTATILSQARKYNVGLVLANQYLGQLDSKLQEAVFTNTSIKFAGGVSAKDARALASEMKCDASFIEAQPKLTFAAYVAGQTNQAVSLPIEPGQMESLPAMNDEQRQTQRDVMRERYAVHYSELSGAQAPPDSDAEARDDRDDGQPDRWE